MEQKQVLYPINKTIEMENWIFITFSLYLTEGTLMATASPSIVASVPTHNMKLCFNFSTLKNTTVSFNFSEKLYTPTPVPRVVAIIPIGARPV